MGVIVEEDFKRWAAKRRTALVTEILKGMTSVSEAARSFNFSPSEIEDWVDDGVIIPFLTGIGSRVYAAMANRCFGVIPPKAMFGRS